MLTRISWVGGLLGLALAGACGQTPLPPGTAKTMLVEPPAPLLPASESLVDSSAIWPAPADTAEAQTILKEDGLSRMETRISLVPTASKQIASGWVKAYQFGDATGALSAYTYFRTGGRPVAGGKVNATDVETPGGERVFLSGTSVVRAQIKQYPESLSSLLAKIEVGLPKIGGRRGLAPLLPSLLPVDVDGVKLEAASARYALGPTAYQAMGGVLPPEILGWDKSAEVITANYAGHGSKGTLTLLLYPTPQIAGDRGRAVEKAANDNKASLGTVKLRRVGPLVGMTSGGLTATQAQALVTALHLNEEISLDKPMPLEFHTEVRKTATLLQSIAVFTGIMILAAIVIGIFLGGGRAAYRVMRGKSAASEPEFLTINLRDKPKALFAPKGPDERSGGSTGSTA